jgi:hypothetical protein
MKTTEEVDQLLLVNMPKEFSPESKVGKMLNRLLVDDEGRMDQESCVEVSDWSILFMEHYFNYLVIL